ncbi:MAG: hypothetical protein B6U94_03970 [Thermofilum sp. ex4484_79]|nr:MAG: hypothetical protein B6U94_03970 [Thermofilum sp. ex4484_79]
MAVPLALMVLYDEMTITQYLVGVPFTTNTDNTIHSPSTSSKNKCKSLLLQRTSPYPLLPSVCTTFNSILRRLLRYNANTSKSKVKGKIKSVIKEDKLEKFLIYIEQRT